MTNNPLLITGGAGFIGGCFIRQSLASGDVRIVNVDKLTYAGNLDSIPEADGEQLVFAQLDIADAAAIADLFETHRPRAIINFAAESHVDRSIDGPAEFVQTNVVGTTRLLQAALEYWRGLPAADRDAFRFLHVSTDEVYGSLGADGAFTETTPYAPNSPYSASKAASDHFVRAWHHTYGLPTIVSNCSNNYGPYQFPEKLIPLMILNALEGKPLPVYGDGQNVRDWLYVEDHCRALRTVLERGCPGETYNIGGDCERTNLQIVHTICDILDQLRPRPSLETRHSPPATRHSPPDTRHPPLATRHSTLATRHSPPDTHGASHRELITYVEDRPGHDRRYAIDATKIRQELGWSPSVRFDDGMRKTVQWYLDNHAWVERIESGVYRRERLGVA